MLYAMSRVVLAVLALMLAVSGILSLAWRLGTSPQEIYSVPEMRAALAHHRGVWGGRTIIVRGVVATTQNTYPCARPSCALIGLAGSLDDPPSGTFWLGQGSEDSFWATLRHLPFVSRLAPALKELQLGKVATYRIHVLARPDCSGARCYDALLLDTAPFTPIGQSLTGAGAMIGSAKN
jgi:hypothetical protein